MKAGVLLRYHQTLFYALNLQSNRRILQQEYEQVVQFWENLCRFYAIKLEAAKERKMRRALAVIDREVAGYLDERSLCSMGTACAKWRHFSTDERLYEKLTIRRFGLIPSQLRHRHRKGEGGSCKLTSSLEIYIMLYKRFRRLLSGHVLCEDEQFMCLPASISRNSLLAGGGDGFGLGGM